MNLFFLSMGQKLGEKPVVNRGLMLGA